VKLSTESERTRWLAFVQAQQLPLDVQCSPYKATRSNEQNNLLWGICYPPLVERTGYTPEEIHEYALGKHFGWVDRKVPKTPRNPAGVESVPRRTTTRDENGKRSVLNKADFAAFVETVERIAAEAGVFIPMERAA
jgi:hypothetical protein